MRHREEYLNIKFADLLVDMGILAEAEVITSHRLPDIVVLNYWGIRLIIEGKVADVPNHQNILEGDCLRRIEDGIAHLVIGIVYPSHLRSLASSELRIQFLRSSYKIKIFSESGTSEWTTIQMDGITAIIRVAYESLISESVVNVAVDDLDNHIELAVRELSGSPGTYERLRNLLTIPNI
jgi:hypothetical protein